MKLCDLLNFLNLDNDSQTIVNSIVFNIDEIKNDSIFILISNKYIKKINKILKKKPVAIISAFNIKKTIYVESLKQKLTPLFIYFNNLDLSKINIIGITGTEMKSSVAKLLFDTLNLANKKNLLLSTSFFGKDIINTSLTTPQGNELVKYLKYAIDNHYENFIFEISSISIEEYRINGIKIDEVILTNIEVDHLDYHKSLENYYIAKKKILNKSKKVYALEDEIKKINYDKEYIKIENCNINNNTITYKNKNYNFSYLNSYHLNGIKYILEYINHNNIKVDISNIKYPEGRMDVLSDKPYIVIDYAHSSNSFNNVCKYFVKKVKGKKIIVFGAGGEREKEKRIIYGNIADILFDVKIVTEDNSRNESFNIIKKDIIKNNPKHFKVIKNRKKAVNYAFSQIESKEDGILFIGKGVERFINKKNKHIAYNEKEYVCSILKKLM